MTIFEGDFYRANEAFSWAQRADPAYANSWIGQAILAEKLARKEAMDLFRHATQLGYHSQAAMGYSHWVLSTLLNPHAEKDDLYVYTVQNMHAIIVAADAVQQHISEYTNYFKLSYFISKVYTVRNILKIQKNFNYKNGWNFIIVLYYSKIHTL